MTTLIVDLLRKPSMKIDLRKVCGILLFWGGVGTAVAQPPSSRSAAAATAEKSVYEVAHTYQAAPYERRCMTAFNDTASGVHSVNAFLLAKMTELMYAERLDYQLRYLHNNRAPIDTFESSDWLSKNCLVNADNFEQAFEHRFQHYFGTSEQVQFRFLKKTYTEKAHFAGFKYTSGLDPELMVVSTPKMVLILFRGTDRVEEHKWAEWLGTDFRLHQRQAGGALTGTRIHTGFWMSFDLIRDDLIAALTEFKAHDKKIWLAGHSLGAALSVIAGTYLKASGWNVQNIYAYACPRTIGNRAFHKKVNKLLPNRVQRFEYFQDPITMVWMPGFRYDHIGQRNWYDEEKLGDYKFYKDTPERRFGGRSLRKCTHISYDSTNAESRRKARRIKRCQHSGTTFVTMKMGHYHNPQWYVKAAYAQLTDEEKHHLPQIDDSYPYFYYGLEGTK